MTGTVTFVFSDLEGSTRLLASLRSEFGRVLVDYYSVVGDIFSSHGGTEVDRAGDGLFFSFPSAREALAAGVEAQKAIAAHEWPSGVSVRARIGLHTGEATTAAHGFFGMDVHRAARLAAAGHGGQLLISQTTRDLVSGDLPDGTTLIDLGEHWLKDLAEPEHLYQVNVDGLPSAFPPLKSLVTLPNNLPRHLTTFIGRRRDVTEVTQLTTEGALVTLTGAGGVGKTRLCLQVAAEVLENFVDGAWLVELETITDEALVAQQVAATLGAAGASDADAEEALIGHLKSREALIILDNCEHLVAASARLSNVLLKSCPGLRILATSRESLGVPGERTYPVRSLDLPEEADVADMERLTSYEAVTLFAERARAADPSFAVATENAAAVIEICRRLDGIPLALELAAARVRALTVQQIAERLDERFRLLTGGSRTVMPRHQTLRAAIEWSFGLLPNAERAVLWRLSAFTGSFSLEAAEAVSVGQDVEDIEVIDHLTRLIEKSLVNRQGDRYRILETVRGFARERSLENGESQGAYGRHRDWYLEFVRKAAPTFFRGPESTDWLARLEVEYDNVRAALAWSLNDRGAAGAALELVAGLWRFWEIRGYLVEGRQWIEQILGATDGNTSLLRADVLTGAGILAAAQGDHTAAVRLHAESLAAHRKIGDRQSINYALHNLANATLHEGDHARARELYEEVVATGRSGGDRRGLPIALFHLAEVCDRQGDYDAARDHFEEAIDIARAERDFWATAYALTSYAQAAMRRGNSDDARRMYDESLAIYRELGDKRGEARAMTLLADLASANGDPAAARNLLYEALQIRCSLGDEPAVCAALESFSGASLEADAARATRILASAAAMRERTGARLSMTGQAAIDQQLGALQQALGSDFAAAWQQGRTSTMDDAVRDAAAIVGR
ncbi:MAG: tetratricopeptide repeat protein [Candidatus Limnocylindrales bacterium]